MEYASFKTSVTKRQLKFKQIYRKNVPHVLLCMKKNGGISAQQRIHRHHQIAVQSAIKSFYGILRKYSRFKFKMCKI